MSVRIKELMNSMTTLSISLVTVLQVLLYVLPQECRKTSSYTHILIPSLLLFLYSPVSLLPPSTLPVSLFSVCICEMYYITYITLYTHTYIFVCMCVHVCAWLWAHI